MSTTTRRGLLLGAGAAVLAGLTGCAAPGDPAAGGVHVATSAPGAEPTRSATPTATPTPTPAPSPTPAVDPTAVAARYAGATPTAWGVDLPGIVTSLPAGASPRVALTFDACGGRGGSQVDTRLLDTLRREGVPATLFLNSRWIQANTALATELIADPLFVIANHGTRHVPLSVTGQAAYGIPGTASAAEAVDEVWQNQLLLTGMIGTAPQFFRSGTAHYDDIGLAIVHDLGVHAIGFAVNGDGGATFSPKTVRHEVGGAPDGAIVLCHMNQPAGGTAEGIAGAIADLRARGLSFSHVVI